ncbi:hypothetical protein [Synechococcus sp. CB0205]|uniref:ribbon-helix-helix domain-containing protein n=1 Tax=Synechococcus sp. CB0205 TaxID=232363 RepID=UPI00020011CA|nr:hypothetical protein [Synechococcus sp. CB0205]
MPRANPQKNVRACISIRSDIHERLSTLAEQEGRSFSNLCAYLLEQAIASLKQDD